MTLKAEMPDDTTGAKVHASTVNGMNEAALRAFIAEIEGQQIKIDEIMRNAAAACQPLLDEIKSIKKSAAESGIAKKPLNAKLRERSLKRKAEGCRETLSEQQQAIFDELTAKLGEMPLFEAALRN